MNARRWVLILIWFVSTTWIHSIPRENFYFAWSLFSLAFATYFLLLYKDQIPFKTGIALMVGIRLAGFFFMPLLSDDYFRFIWDGWIAGAGIHPMAFTPGYIMEHPELISAPADIFQKLNSPAYYSVYPPAAQWMFAVAYKINGLDVQGHVLFYKILLTFVDALIVYLLYLLLLPFHVPKEKVLLYGLNPLIILEFTGNLHFDGLMIAGLLGAMVASHKKNPLWPALPIAFSVLIKLVSLLLLPFLVGRWPWKKIFLMSAISFLLVVIPFFLYTGMNMNWLNSVVLWFQQFEFNASLYYLLRELGQFQKGYNLIALLGPVMAGITLLGTLWLWIRYRLHRDMTMFAVMLYGMTLYYLLSTTIHPWYMGIVLVLGILSQRLYPVIWTYVVFLSYSHYENGMMNENYILIAAEYTLLFSFMFWEFSVNRIKKRSL